MVVVLQGQAKLHNHHLSIRFCVARIHLEPYIVVVLHSPESIKDKIQINSILYFCNHRKIPCGMFDIIVLIHISGQNTIQSRCIQLALPLPLITAAHNVATQTC